jgi:ribosome maturation factor RimP
MMMAKNIADTVREIAEPEAEKLGLRIWDVVYIKEGAEWFLRIFIDKDGGVSIDDCVNMTHAMDPILDKNDPVPQEYTLEVSSPGIERKLTRKEHFEMYSGYPVRIRLIRPFNGIKEYEGILGDSDGDSFHLTLDDGTKAVFQKKECSCVNLIDTEFTDAEDND